MAPVLATGMLVGIKTAVRWAFDPSPEWPVEGCNPAIPATVSDGREFDLLYHHGRTLKALISRWAYALLLPGPLGNDRDGPQK